MTGADDFEPAEERRPLGCCGCLLIIAACLALDALTIFAGFQIVTVIGGFLAGLAW